MGLTYAKEEQLRKQPIVESKVKKSNDGKYIVHKLIITDIKAVPYYEKVLANQETEEDDEDE